MRPSVLIFFSSVPVLVALTVAAVCAAQASAATPCSVSCAGTSTLNGKTCPDGVIVVDINANNPNKCKLSITDSTMPWIEFKGAPDGAGIEIIIDNNTFLPFLNDNIPQLPSPSNNPSAIAFDHGVSQAERIQITNNRWNTNATYVQGVNFITFDGAIGAVLGSVTIEGNQWTASVPNPIPNAVPPPTIQHRFLLCTANVNLNNAAFILSNNVWNASSASGYGLIFIFAYFQGTLSYTPLLLADNHITMTAEKLGDKAQFRVLFLTQSVTTGKGQSAFNLLRNDVAVNVEAPDQKYHPIAMTIVEVDGNINAYQHQQRQDPLNQMMILHNNIVVSAACDASVFQLLTIQGAVQLANLNATANFIKLGLNPAVSVAETTMVSFANNMLPAGAGGVLNITGNEFDVRHNSNSKAVVAQITVLQLPKGVPGNDPKAAPVMIRDIDVSRNELKGQVNASGLQGTVRIWWIRVPPPNQYATAVWIENAIAVSANGMFLFGIGAKVEHFLLVNEATLHAPGGVYMDGNRGLFIFPAAEVGVGLFGSSGNVHFGDVICTNNILTLYRYSDCLGIICPGDKGVGIPLSLTLFSLSGPYSGFGGPAGAAAAIFKGNELHVSSNAILPKSNDAASRMDASLGVFVFLATGQDLDFLYDIQFDGNLIQTEIQAPATPPAPQQNIAALFRVPVFIMAILPPPEKTVIRDFHLERTTFYENHVSAACAPCTMGVFAYNSSSSADAYGSIRGMLLDRNGVEASVPEELYGVNFAADSLTDHYVVAVQMALCLPAPWAYPFYCFNSATVIGVDGNKAVAEVNVERARNIIKFAPSFNITSKFCTGTGTANDGNFPQHFGADSFRLSVFVVKSGSFPSANSDSVHVGIAENFFFWGDVSATATNWQQCLSAEFITTVFTGGEPQLKPTRNDMEVVLPHLKVLAGCKNELGGPIGELLALTKTGYVNICTPAPTTTASPNAVTTTPAPTKNGGTPTPAPSPGKPGSNSTGEKTGSHGGGLSGGATAAIVILLLLAVALTAAFCYLRWPQVKNTMMPLLGRGGAGGRAANLQEYQTVDGDGAGAYGSTRDSEMNSRRMSLASTSASSLAAHDT